MKEGLIRLMLALLIIGVILSAATVYIGTSMYYVQEQREQQRIIELLKDEISYRDAQIAQFVNIKIECPDCHGETKGYHTVEKISIYDKIKGKNPRLCTTCHGLDVHAAHMNKMVREELTCEECHLQNQTLVIVPALRPGDILSCEQCHEDGNYIEVHLGAGAGTCANCHMGGVGKIHEPTMANVEEIIAEAMKLEAMKKEGE
jgi:type II secretory pathway pseudopilin PulG